MRTKDVIALFGTQAKLAAFLNITQPSVSNWGDEVPLLRQYQLRERMPDIDKRIMRLRRRATRR